jgi:K+-sensing histidine kinase KdpD
MEGLTSGVPGDTKPVSFDHFRRGKTTKSGQGPGLFIVRSLVLSYGGRIRAGDAMPGRADAGAAIPFTLGTLPDARNAKKIAGQTDVSSRIFLELSMK